MKKIEEDYGINFTPEEEKVKIKMKPDPAAIFEEGPKDKVWGFEDNEDFGVYVEPDAGLEEWQHGRIIITLPVYDNFYRIGHNGKDEDKSWTDAYMVYNHLYYTGRLQKTRKVWANRTYLKNGLNWGADKVDNALKWLSRHGFIYKSKQNKRNGIYGKAYVTIKYMSKMPVALEEKKDVPHRCPETDNGEKTTDNTHRCLDTDNGDRAAKLSSLRKKETEDIKSSDAPVEGRTGTGVKTKNKPSSKLVKPSEVKAWVSGFLKKRGYSLEDAERKDRVAEASRRRRAEYFETRELSTT